MKATTKCYCKCEFSRIFDFAILCYLQNSRKLDVCKKLSVLQYVCIVKWRQENMSLREQLEDVQAQLLSRHVEEGQRLLVNNNCHDTSLMNLTHDQVPQCSVHFTVM